MSIELLLEAERRGILPESKRSILAEAKKRGLVTDTGISTEPTLAERGSSLALKGLSLPLKNPITDRLSGAAQKVGSAVENITGMSKWGGNVAEGLGRAGYPPPESAAYGTAVDMVTSQLPYAFDPKNMATNVGLALLPGASAIERNVVSPKLKQIGKSAIDTGKDLSMKATAKVTKIPEETLRAWEKNPELLESKTVEAIASSDIPEVTRKFEIVRTELSKKGNELLSNSKYLADGAISKDSLISAIKSSKGKIGAKITPEEVSASNALDRIAESYKQKTNTISQKSLKNTIEKLDDKIPWEKVWKEPQSLTKTDKSFIDLRAKLDTLLKSKNPEYAKSMNPLSEAINERNQYFKKFGIESIRKVTDKGSKKIYVPGDVTATRLAGLGKEGKLGSSRVAEGVKEITGEDLSAKVQNALWREEIENASRRIPFTNIKIGTGGIAKKAVDWLR